MSEQRFRTYSEKYNYLNNAKGQKLFVAATIVYCGYKAWLYRDSENMLPVKDQWGLKFARWLSKNDHYK